MTVMTLDEALPDKPMICPDVLKRSHTGTAHIGRRDG
jgi:hypothetical protein